MPTRRITADSVRACARPTVAQQHELVEHLSYAHSWYKHVPLGGAEFVVFLGEGTRYGRSMDVDTYRRLCGLLDYAWRFDPAGGWTSDSGEVELDDDVVKAGGVRLYPWCSNDLAAPEVLTHLHVGHVAGHPCKAELTALFAAEKAAEAAWQALPEALREEVVRYDADAPAAADAEVRACVAARRARDVAYRTLRAPEVAKLHQAIAAALAL